MVHLNHNPFYDHVDLNKLSGHKSAGFSSMKLSELLSVLYCKGDYRARLSLLCT